MFHDRDSEWAQLGITRVADLTGLDPIGLPVWASYRPNARSLSVCQGKGLSRDHARLSAIMEAIETALAEDVTRLDALAATREEMAAGDIQTVPLEAMRKCQDARLADGAQLYWVPGKSLARRQPVWAPFELVGLDWREGAPWNHSAFKMTSVGLAAHFSEEQAILHGLLEAIEYDAVALAFAWPGVLASLPRIDAGACGDPDLKLAVDQVRGAGFSVEFVDLTSDIGLPAVLCVLDGASATHDRKRAAPFAGHACRLDMQAAMLAALLEAVQTQATDISGARDDICDDDFTLTDIPVGEADAPEAPLVAPQPTPAIMSGSAAEQLDFIRQRLAARGIDDVFVFDLAGGEFGVSCVSVLCPQLEVGRRDKGFRQGARSRARLLQHALGGQ